MSAPPPCCGSSDMLDRVLIVGAGPVGLACALFLVQRGVPVVVFEAEAVLPTDMRASTFHPPTLDMLSPFGIADLLVAEGHKARQWQYRRQDTGESIVFDLDVLAGLTQHPFRLQCEQFRLTHAIADRLQGHPLFTLVFGARAVRVEQTAAGVTACTETDGTETRYDGAYLVGADGAKSCVRRCLEIELKGETYARTSITAVVDFPFESHFAGLLNVNYVWTEQDHFSLMRVRDNWRIGFSPKPDQPVEQALEEGETQARLQEFLPTGSAYRIVHKAAYTVHRRVVDDFRAGRILLAGDAAHLNSPSGGMGMNSGVHDAHNLADKLARVLAGADPSLLDRYARQRRAIAVEDVQVQSDRNHRRHREKDPAQREIIWAELRETAADRDSMRGFLMNSSLLNSLKRAEEVH